MGELKIEAGGLEGLRTGVVAATLDADGEPAAIRDLLDRRYGGAVSRALERGTFRGSEKEARLVSAGVEGRPDLLLLGPPSAELSVEERVRRAAGRAVREGRERGAGSVGFLVVGADSAHAEPAVWQAVAEGLALGAWRYDELKGEEARRDSRRPPEKLVLLPPRPGEPSAAITAAVQRGAVVSEVQNSARALVSQPGNLLTPTRLAARAVELGERHGISVQVWGPEKLRDQGFGALLAVSRGSCEEPRFLILEHEGGGDAPYVLVGKGVTFDAGGISLKPASGMESMKYDMAGAAAVLGTLEAAARLGVRRRLIGLVPATENLPSGRALKPGDVIRGLSGRSIEVVNTDAEGRLILSDALEFATRLQPTAIVDLATLTGACVVALGHHAVGLMTPDDALAADLTRAGDRSGERLWRLPLWREYREALESDIADVKNSGGRPAGTITAGRFLQEFVGDVPWAHLDIAGTAWTEESRDYHPKGATGVGVRLLVEWLRPAT